MALARARKREAEPQRSSEGESVEASEAFGGGIRCLLHPALLFSARLRLIGPPRALISRLPFSAKPRVAPAFCCLCSFLLRERRLTFPSLFHPRFITVLSSVFTLATRVHLLLFVSACPSPPQSLFLPGVGRSRTRSERAILFFPTTQSSPVVLGHECTVVPPLFSSHGRPFCGHDGDGFPVFRPCG